MKDTFNP
jgi:cation-transporting P-type ATPase 13A2